jgi:hypothetical protein
MTCLISSYANARPTWRISGTEVFPRLKVLRFCDKVNLNEFTLFDSEEGLLEMQAMRVFDLRP